MYSKRLLLVFAFVLLLTSEITAAKELAYNHESDKEDAKYEHDVPQHYNDGLRVKGFINRRLSQATYPGGPSGGSYGLPPGTPCCSRQAEATRKQAKEAQTHN